MIFLGFPPVINRAGTLPSNSIRIGINICIDPQSPVPVVRVVCAQIGSINPEPVSSYTFTNQPIDHAYFFITQFMNETGLNNMIHVYPELLLEYNMQGSLNCVLQNRFGNDSETTKILYSKPVAINGSILVLNISNNGCNRPGITNTTADLCPLDGETVVISCSSDEGYTISGPGGCSTNTPLVIWRFSLSYSGIYICRSDNTDCGVAEDSIVVSASGQSTNTKD